MERSAGTMLDAHTSITVLDVEESDLDEVVNEDDNIGSKTMLARPDEMWLSAAKDVARASGVTMSEWWEVSQRSRQEIEDFLAAITQPSTSGGSSSTARGSSS